MSYNKRSYLCFGSVLLLGSVLLSYYATGVRKSLILEARLNAPEKLGQMSYHEESSEKAKIEFVSFEIFSESTCEIRSNLEDEVSETDKRFNTQFNALDARMDQIEVRMDNVEDLLDKIDSRLEKIEGTLDKIAKKFKIIDATLTAP